MEILAKKTKAMLVNFTGNHQFHTRMKLKGQNVELVDKMKILGTVITNLMSWTENCTLLIKKVNARMQLIQKVWSFGSTLHEMVGLWKTFCRSILEQTCVVWDSGLTNQNSEDLERTQKTFVKLIMEGDYKNYTSSLRFLNLETLENRRKKLLVNFAKNSIVDGHFRDLFPKRTKTHSMETRKLEKYTVFHAITERYKSSPILTMQRMLNQA